MDIVMRLWKRWQTWREARRHRPFSDIADTFYYGRTHHCRCHGEVWR